MDMWVLVSFLVAGFLLGFLNPDRHKLLVISGYILHIGLLILIGIMGARIGADEEIIADLARIGRQSFALALGGIAGSLLFLKLLTLFNLFSISPGEHKVEENEEVISSEDDNSLKLTLIIFLTVTLGVVAGWFMPGRALPWLEDLTQYALAVLFLGVGVDLGFRRHVLQKILEWGWKLLLIPIFVGIGSVVGTVLTGSLLGFALNEAGAVGAGFGWYSLSAVLLSELHTVELGSIAFLTNIMREMMALLTIPLIARLMGKMIAIGPAGATSMDVTLPLLKKAGGEEIVIPAFINGVILTALVPLLVPFIISL